MSLVLQVESMKNLNGNKVHLLLLELLLELHIHIQTLTMNSHKLFGIYLVNKKKVT